MSTQTFLRPLLLAASAPLALACAIPAIAQAQAIERNLPPAPQAEPQAIIAPNLTPNSQDDRPIGPTLSGILLLGPQDEVRNAKLDGVSTGLVRRADNAAARAALRPFIGKPMSRKLIAQVESALARYYREAGYPFVSLSTPPQTIGGGLLQVRVVEFHDGAVTVTGAKGKDADRIRQDVRLQPGQAIDAPQLSADLDWINRYPFHHAEAVFSPGDALSGTDLQLQVTDDKPWQVYAGYANSGSASTGWDRYMLGGEVGGLIVPGSLLSYQFTASPDFFDDHGSAFGDASHPEYLSHGLRAAFPVAPRQEIEVSFDHVETNQVAEPFKVRQDTDELSVGYRTSLSNFSGLPGDLGLGVEAKSEQRDTFFGGASVLNDTVQVYQFYADWTHAWTDMGGASNLDLAVHASPGGVGARNTGAAFAQFSNGRVIAGDYEYFTGQFSRSTRLPAGWSLSDTLIAQVAWKPLPDTEQMGVGGADLVRGYTLDDGAYDRAFVLRNELRPPAVTFALPGAHMAAQASPFAFLDAGYGAQEGPVVKTVRPASVGAGTDLALAPAVSVNVTGAYALDNAIATRAGGWRLEARAMVRF